MAELRRFGDVVDLPETVELTLKELLYGAFAAGARWNMRETSLLSPHIARFIEMLILLGIADDENASLEAEHHSPLWRTAGAGTPGYTPEPPY